MRHSRSARSLRGRLVWLTALILVAACDGGTSGPRGPAIGGAWSYRFSLAGAAIVCESTTAHLQVDQVVAGGTPQFDQRFGGTVANFDLTCRRIDQSPVRSGVLRFGPTTIAGGVLRGRDLAFDLEAPDLLHTGVLEDERMTGSVAARLDLSSLPLGVTAPVNLTGTWEAIR